MSAGSDSTRETLLNAGAISLACLIFLALALFQLDLPGLYADEAFDVIPAMQIVLGHSVELQRNVGVHLFGLSLPLMSSSDYQGVTSTYLVLPFFWLFGVNVVSLRLMTISVGVLGLVLTFFLARKWFGSNVARLSVLMLATSPSWVFWSRLGVYVVSQVMPIAAGSLIAFTTWVKRRPIGRRNGALYLGTFLLGLGLTTKILFLWFIAAVPIVALILYGARLWDSRGEWLKERGRWLKVALLSGLSFCAGAFPFILYNILSGGTFDLIRSTLSAPGTSNGIDNSALLRNLWTRVDNFRVLLDGSYFWFQAAPGTSHANPITPPLFAIAALGLLVLILWDRARTTPLRIDFQGSLRLGSALVALALLISLLLAGDFLPSRATSVVVLATIALALVGAVVYVRAVLRHPGFWTAGAAGLLIAASLAGTVWWVAGAGRPVGRAPDAFLGLWPIDAAGAVAWIIGAGLIFLLGWDRNPVPWQRSITATLGLLGLVVGESIVTVSGLWSTHLIMLFPLPQMVIAAFAVSFASRALAFFKSIQQYWVRATAFAVPALVIVGSIVLFDLRTSIQYQRDMSATGGASTFSDSIYALATYLDTRNPTQKVVSLDWGIKRPIQFLTHEHVNPLDAYGYESTPSQATIDGIGALVQESGNLYLFHDPQAGIAYPRFDLFSRKAAEAGKQPVLERTFYSRNGLPVYEVYSLAP
ncbi:MAG TPA: glycosyltransferase family 39 protein [Chloroflexia bacterium]|nr:glycosyltransferase family 39 protein [Chloroflexia bacterium]